MATVYFFNGTQSGTADGSYADPYDLSSLASRESASSSGDVFIFKDGTYAITASLTLGADGVTYEAETTGNVTFNFSSANNLSLGDSSSTYPGFSLKGIIFDNLNGIIGLRIIDGDLLIAEECQFKGMSSTYKCILGDTASTDNGYAMNATFTRCIFSGSTSSNDVDFFRYRLGGVQHNLTLNNCTCVFTNNATNQFFITTTSGSVTVKNSILAEDGSGTTTLGTANSFTESNNCYFGIGQSADPANGIIVDDPQFVDSANGDYRLRPSSPCIGAGTAS